jgi:hypothetical protein
MVKYAISGTLKSHNSARYDGMKGTEIYKFCASCFELNRKSSSYCADKNIVNNRLKTDSQQNIQLIGVKKS